MKHWIAIAVLLLAGCAGLSQDPRSGPEGCRYPGASAECRGLHTG